ncbi:hypothetical protein [Chloroflexus sp.]|uniref:hypothetical protein n=1 Tax=Chloroflexus sp. TaxID=1904827 RepID=UPI002ACD643D|nr:hypothetical protein [Chloroflexus sp.]
MRRLLALAALGAAAFALHKWYNREVLLEGEGFVRLQSEHEHFHFHVDLPPGMEIQPGDTLEIMHLPPTEDGRTNGEICYRSPIRLYKASWLRRFLTKKSSLVEINELVEHP